MFTGRARVSRRAVLATLPALLAGCRRETTPSGAVVPRVEVHDVGDFPEDWLALPNGLQSFKFAVIGDSGRGWAPQHEVARRMARYRERFAYPLVLMLGDNIYEGPATPDDYRRKFEEPYRTLLDAGVRFQAVLGNHDDRAQRFYAPFNMGGERYYTFEPPGPTFARVTIRCACSPSTAPASIGRNSRGSPGNCTARGRAGSSVCCIIRCTPPLAMATPRT